ncbi:hypothetical protein [Adhaeretor mobilis]|uniref:hypothetical protein n=1 Tax=Adhaeretor mobilis TaxID=1930276 RepID=UPI0011AAA905|nr:hypothetical protein [Adhaeretor mobilis]
MAPVRRRLFASDSGGPQTGESLGLNMITTDRSVVIPGSQGTCPTSGDRERGWQSRRRSGTNGLAAPSSDGIPSFLFS